MRNTHTHMQEQPMYARESPSSNGTGLIKCTEIRPLVCCASVLMVQCYWFLILEHSQCLSKKDNYGSFKQLHSSVWQLFFRSFLFFEGEEVVCMSSCFLTFPMNDCAEILIFLKLQTCAKTCCAFFLWMFISFDRKHKPPRGSVMPQHGLTKNAGKAGVD